MNQTVKKNVYMIQISPEYAGTVYLPYSIGAIAAYAWADDKVKEHYSLKPFIYRRSEIESIAAGLESPSFAAFSVYLWNFEFSKALASLVKSIYPDCKIVFGGHSAVCSEVFLEENPFIDFVIDAEGEQPFAALLRALVGEQPLESVPNILFRDDHGVFFRVETQTAAEIDYPSPYLEGYFDEIISRDRDMKFSAVIETNRGCPHRCSYCDWGVLNRKVRLFPYQKIAAEIEWVSEHHIEYLYVADANFGMFARDVSIAGKIAEAKVTNGYPDKFFVNFTKNSNLRVFEINQFLTGHQLSKGATLSFQSFSPVVLKNIHRINMNYRHFGALMGLYNSSNIMTYSELILGLPGETYESFAMALGKLLEAGQHNSIIVVKCHCLANAEMSQPDYMKKHGIETVQAPIDNAHFIPQQEEQIPEYSQIVVSTATMNRPMWVETEMLSLCVQCYHSFGLLRYFAVYQFYEYGVKYEAFYQKLVQWLKENPDSAAGKVFNEIHREVEKSSQGKGVWFYQNDLFGKIAWPYEEGMFLEILYNSGQFYREIASFLETFEWDEKLLPELLNYQKLLLKQPVKEKYTERFRYDFHTYFRQACAGQAEALNHTENTITVSKSGIPAQWDRFAIDIVWFGRRGGNTLYTDISQMFR